MTLKEFVDTNWHRGNVVKLKNGKEYLVKGVKGHGRYLLLYSLEFDAKFVADYRIVDCRTSDYEEPEEVYLEMKRQKQAEAEAKREAERQEFLRAKAERKRKNIEAQERAHQEALARKAAKKKAQAKAEPKKESKTSAPAEPKSRASSAKPQAQAEVSPELLDTDKQCAKFRACSPELLDTDKQCAKKVETPKVIAEAPKSVEDASKSLDAKLESEGCEEQPAPETPKKRIRQRIRITAAPVREKVEFFKKKK